MHAILIYGYSLSKKGKADEIKHRRIAIFFLLALILISLAVPWPWSAVARNWLPQV